MSPSCYRANPLLCRSPTYDHSNIPTRCQGRERVGYPLCPLHVFSQLIPSRRARPPQAENNQETHLNVEVPTKNPRGRSRRGESKQEEQQPQ